MKNYLTLAYFNDKEDNVVLLDGKIDDEVTLAQKSEVKEILKKKRADTFYTITLIHFELAPYYNKKSVEDSLQEAIEQGHLFLRNQFDLELQGLNSNGAINY